MPPGVADFIGACVDGRANILIAGGTASGKTTLMRVLAGTIPDRERVVVVEDSAELHLEADRGCGPLDPATGQRLLPARGGRVHRDVYGPRWDDGHDPSCPVNLGGVEPKLANLSKGNRSCWYGSVRPAAGYAV